VCVLERKYVCVSVWESVFVCETERNRFGYREEEGGGECGECKYAHTTFVISFNS